MRLQVRALRARGLRRRLRTARGGAAGERQRHEPDRDDEHEDDDGETDASWTVLLARSTSAAILALAFVVVRPKLKLTRAAAVLTGVALIAAG